MDLDRIWVRRLLRIVYGFFPDVEDEAYGLITDFYRMWRTRLTDCLRICTGFGGGGLRIVYGFGPDLGEEACGLFLDLDRIWGRRLTDCLRIFSGCGGRGLRIVYGFFPGCGGRGLTFFASNVVRWE